MDARLDGEALSDGQLRTACVQSCPTQAIIFGDLNDPESAVSKHGRSHRAMRVLEEKNTDPHVIYLRPERIENAF